VELENEFVQRDVSSTTLEGNEREFFIVPFDQVFKDIAVSEAVATSVYLYTDNITPDLILQSVKFVSKSLHFLQTTGSGDFLKLRS
jgi:hypothetical protein